MSVRLDVPAPNNTSKPYRDLRSITAAPLANYDQETGAAHHGLGLLYLDLDKSNLMVRKLENKICFR